MLVGNIKKSNGQIRVNLEEFKGKVLLHIRFFFQNKDGELLPTKKGVTFTPDQLDSLMNLITQAKASLDNGQARIEGK